MNIKILCLLMLVSLFSIQSSAIETETQEKSYLIQILNQLNAIKPFVVAAKKSQPKNTRIQFHYTKFKDANGDVHSGLLEDIDAIEEGIKAKINQTGIEPRHFQPIKGDYLDVGRGAHDVK